MLISNKSSLIFNWARILVTVLQFVPVKAKINFLCLSISLEPLIPSIAVYIKCKVIKNITYTKAGPD